MEKILKNYLDGVQKSKDYEPSILDARKKVEEIKSTLKGSITLDHVGRYDQAIDILKNIEERLDHQNHINEENKNQIFKWLEQHPNVDEIIVSNGPSMSATAVKFDRQARSISTIATL